MSKEENKENKIYIYYIGCVCYASSHDDLIGIFTDKDLADAECAKLNREFVEEENEYQEFRKQTVQAWGEPFYVGKQDITRLVYGYGLNPEETDWVAIYSVPSLGEFQLYPRSGTAIEAFKTNTTDRPKDLNWDHEGNCYR